MWGFHVFKPRKVSRLKKLPHQKGLSLLLLHWSYFCCCHLMFWLSWLSAIGGAWAGFGEDCKLYPNGYPVIILKKVPGGVSHNPKSFTLSSSLATRSFERGVYSAPKSLWLAESDSKGGSIPCTVTLFDEKTEAMMQFTQAAIHLAKAGITSQQRI